jgi:DNA-binding CsgD family transcriptional regulator
MKKYISIWCLTFLAVIIKAETGNINEAILKDLDAAIKNRALYHAAKEQYISIRKEKLKTPLPDEERFEIYAQLYEACVVYQTDSALKFIEEQAKMLSTLKDDKYRHKVFMNRAGAMTVSGMYKEASEILEQIHPDKLSADLLITYYQRYRTLYGHIADYALTQEDKAIYRQYTDSYRDSLLAVLPPDGFQYLISEADQLNVQGQYDKTIDLIKNTADTCRNPDITRYLAHILSVAYREKGDGENRERYLIKSAIADIQFAVREYASLKELTFLLYEKGDLDRAYEYMKCSLEDALACNARSRTVEVAKILPVITKAHQYKSQRKERVIYILFCAMTFLALCLVGTVIYDYSRMKKLTAARKALSETNDQLQTLNNTLSETNIIKEEYIAQYMNRCSIYIDKMDKYRRKLAKLATTGKLTDLYKEIKDEDIIEAERQDFYKEFDHTFLGIFPNFVNAFNDLLCEKDRIHPKSGELLNTELRIFALIRLGITDSAKIADFLQYSITTVYNYRSKIRHKALGDKNQLEERVIMIK